jgi:hypothetical protein
MGSPHLLHSAQDPAHGIRAGHDFSAVEPDLRGFARGKPWIASFAVNADKPTLLSGFAARFDKELKEER